MQKSGGIEPIQNSPMSLFYKSGLCFILTKELQKILTVMWQPCILANHLINCQTVSVANVYLLQRYSTVKYFSDAKLKHVYCKFLETFPLQRFHFHGTLGTLCKFPGSGLLHAWFGNCSLFSDRNRKYAQRPLCSMDKTKTMRK